jgi:hypothetical protein
MNIFFLHTNPRKCARWHCDKHVVKMLLETCQLLYSCHWLINPSGVSLAPPCKNGTAGYKLAHKNHPCAKWVRMSLSNYKWLTTLGLELLREYKFRFNGKEHACGPHIEWLDTHPPIGLEDLGWYEPLLAMPDIYKNGDSVSSYRRYYNGAKQKILQWSGRHIPHWVTLEKRD